MVFKHTNDLKSLGLTFVLGITLSACMGINPNAELGASSSVTASSQNSSNQNSSSPSALLTNNKLELLIGSSETGISHVFYDIETQSFSVSELLASITNASFLTINQTGTRVFATEGNEKNYIASFNRDKTSLRLINHQATNGAALTHVALDPSEKYLAASNFWSGDLVVLALNSDGSIQNNQQFFHHDFTGDDARTHWATWNKAGDHIYVAEFGEGLLIDYPFDPKTGKVSASKIALRLKPTDGVRSIALSPSGHLIYLLNEQSSTLVTAEQMTNGEFKEIARTSSLPKDFIGANTAAHLQISQNGHFLYASNRGHNSIAVFNIERNPSQPELIQIISTEGDWPRAFVFVDSVNILFVANERSNDIVAFRVEKDGTLTSLNRKTFANAPSIILPLPPLQQ